MRGYFFHKVSKNIVTVGPVTREPICRNYKQLILQHFGYTVEHYMV